MPHGKSAVASVPLETRASQDSRPGGREGPPAPVLMKPWGKKDRPVALLREENRNEGRDVKELGGGFQKEEAVSVKTGRPADQLVGPLRAGWGVAGPDPGLPITPTPNEPVL